MRYPEWVRMILKNINVSTSRLSATSQASNTEASLTTNEVSGAADLTHHKLETSITRGPSSRFGTGDQQYILTFSLTIL